MRGGGCALTPRTAPAGFLRKTISYRLLFNFGFLADSRFPKFLNHRFLRFAFL